MAVRCSDLGSEARYAGCVLSWHEHNGYNDSDWHAVVWDEASQKVIEVEYMTTRAGCTGVAEIDITTENLRKVYNFYRTSTKEIYEESDIYRAKKPGIGKECKVIRGRKVPVGTIGKVAWMNPEYNPYSRLTVEMCGIVCDSLQYKNQRVPLDYLEVIDFEKYLHHGKVRKRAIRNMVLGLIPLYLHHMLLPENLKAA